MEIFAPDEPVPQRARPRRRWAVLVALGAVAAAAVPVFVNGGGGDHRVAVRAETDGAPQTQAPPFPADAEDGAVVPSGTPDTEVPAAPATGRRSVPSTATPTTKAAVTAPTATTATLPVIVPGVPTTPGTTAPNCPAPPAPARTFTVPGYYLVPIDGGAPRQVLSTSSLHPNEVAASPDGKQLVFSDFDPGENNGQSPFKVYTVGSDGAGLRQIDTGTDHAGGFAWSPDGRWIAFHDQSYPGAAVAGVWVMAPDGTQRRRLFEYPVPGYGWLRWSPDSTHIAASSANNGAGAWAIDVATGASIHLVEEAVWEVDWSPDSKRLVVDITDGSPPTMNGSHTTEPLPIVVVNADGTGRHELVAKGVWAVWSPAGDGIALRDGYQLIDPDTLARRPYGPGAALAYASDGQHLLATGPGLLIDDRRGCGFQLVVTDNRGSPTFVSWAGTDQILIKVLPPA